MIRTRPSTCLKALLAALMLAQLGCESREPLEPESAVTSAASAAEASAAEAEAKANAKAQAASDAKLQLMIEQLDHKIANLEQKLASPATVSGNGSGAYARGTTLRVASDNSGESLLERLRRLEAELASASANVTTKNQTIANLNQQRDAALLSSKQARERADYLAQSSESLVTVQQTLAERQEQISALNAQLAAGELQRLRAERHWYQLASEILRLSPDDARDLPGVQSRIRQATREVRDDTPGKP
jgi:predicted RNase H-like nuclease (RuvC/YqgF family)